LFKKDKTLFITIILMLIIFISVIFVVFLYERKNDEFENQLNSKEKYLNSLKDSNEELKYTNEKLEDTVEDLKEEINDNENNSSLSFEGDMATYYQSMIDLSDISLMIKEGKTKEAKEELQKIDTNGFDQTALSFYEILCRELNIEY